MKKKTLKQRNWKGFTLVEIIMVVVILSIAAFLTVPMLSNAADIQVRAAANRIAADLDYAKGLAITHQRSYSVVFDPAGESYDIRQTATDAIVENPVNPGTYFVVAFSAAGNLDRVNMVDANFDADSTKAITFDYLGSPYSGKGTATPLNSGRITLQDKQTGNFILYVKIEPVTSYVTIDNVP